METITGQTALDHLIAAARKHKMTPAETRAQWVSFVYGQTSNRLTKHEIWERMAERFGWERSVDEMITAQLTTPSLADE